MAKRFKVKKLKSPIAPVVRRVPVDEIIVKAGFRKLDKKIVSSLAESIKEVGLIHPPTVYIKKPAEGNEEVYLLAGQHRLEGVKKIGWKFIDVIVVKRVKDKNRKGQIAENLHRNDLTPAEKGRLIKEWMKLCAKEGGQVAHPHDKGVSDAAKKLGTSRKDIRRKLKAADLSADAEKALEEAGLDRKQQIVLEVAEEKPEDQVAKVKEIIRKREKKAKSKGQKVTNPTLAEDDADGWSDTSFEKLEKAWEEAPEFQKAWRAASVDDRQQFIDEVLMNPEDVAADNDNNKDNEESDDAA